MGRACNISGQRFGALTAVRCLDMNNKGYRVWLCRCDCGGEIAVDTRRLKRGIVTNCGCVPKENARSGSLAEDLSGQRFGLLLVLQRTENKKGHTCWLCRCDCGRTCAVTAHELKSGAVKSCGCMRGLGEHGFLDISGRRFGLLTAMYPLSRRNGRGSVYWHCQCDCGGETDVSEDDLARGNNRSCGCLKKQAQQDIPNRLHRIDGTCVEILEKRKHRSDNSSGFRGVYCLKNGRFRASIGFKGQRFNIGTFETFEKAVEARLEAEKKIHGGFVKAYYRWQEKCALKDGAKDSELLFHVEKKNGEFVVTTNMED